MTPTHGEIPNAVTAAATSCGQDHPDEEQASAEEVLVSTLPFSHRQGHRMTLTWCGSANRAKRHLRHKEKGEPPTPVGLQILRALAALTLLVPDDDERGYTLPGIVSFGMALYPGSDVFEETDGRVVIPIVEIVAGEVLSREHGSLQVMQLIRISESSDGMRSVVGRRNARTRVSLTIDGAHAAIEDGWTPPLPGDMQTLLAQAERCVSLGILRKT